MASPAGQFHPWRLIITFLAITVGLFALVFFTPGSTAPKLGIDLQGGTRVTLLARTDDGSTPTRESMNLARDIMERRVNGSGVAGAQVQIDGSNQLVITVPGQDNLEGLTRSARLNIRPLVDQWYNPLLIQAAPTTSDDGDDTTADEESDDSGATDGTDESTDADTTDDTTTSDEPSATETAPSTEESGQGLRGDAAALAPRAGDDTTAEQPVADTEATSTGSVDAVTTEAATTEAATTDAATTSADSDEATTDDATTTGADGTEDGAATTFDPGLPDLEEPPLSAFPEGSDPAVPIQPASGDEAAVQAWETIVAGYKQNPGTGPTCGQIKYYQGLDKADLPILACDPEGQFVYLLEQTLIPGTEIKDATSQFDTQSGHGWVINVDFKSDGFKIWSAYTTAHYDKTGGTNPPPDSQTAFTLDGEVLSAPVINQPITTPGTMVSGSFTQQSAKALADSLKFGALPLAFDRQESEQVSAELGFQYLKAGLIAGGIGLALVVLYCLVYYRLLGIITILSLVLSGLLVYAVMVLLGRWIGLSLDMAGIAGLIIAIGITADSFVVYFERIKDEVREGRTFRSSVHRGWARAKKTILSADAVTLLSAVILYILAVGDVKGFAFTLGLSTVLDLLVVFLVTHPLVALLSKANIFAHPVWSGLGSVARAGQEHREAAAQLQVKEA